MKKLKLLFGSTAALLTLIPAVPVHAATSNVICSIFPFLQNLTFAGGLCVQGGIATGAKGALTAGQSLISLALELVFVGIIVVAIYIIIKAALKYIRSEGEEGKIQEAQKAIKSVFIGIAALFIGIIGIVIILAFFNASVDTTQTQQNINNVVPQNILPTP